MGLTSSMEAGVFRSVKRACYAGLGAVALRLELAERVAPMIPVEAYSFAMTDPDLGLITHAVAQNISAGFMSVYLEWLYPEDLARMLDVLRSGRHIYTAMSANCWDALRASGLAHEVNMLACTSGGLWGSWCMLREVGSPAFSERERRFLQRIAPHVARGLRQAALLDAIPTCAPGNAAVTSAGGEVPGVLLLDANGRKRLCTEAADAYLADIQDIGMEPGVLPYAVVSALFALRLRHERTGGDGADAPADAVLRVRGSSGRWYAVRAVYAEPDAWGDVYTVVVLQPLAPPEMAPLLARLYGLSPREREVLAFVARGFSTKETAARLGLSSHTVQEHLNNACEKVGVHGRKALLARFFFDGFFPGLAGPPSGRS